MEEQTTRGPNVFSERVGLASATGSPRSRRIATHPAGQVQFLEVLRCQLIHTSSQETTRCLYLPWFTRQRQKGVNVRTETPNIANVSISESIGLLIPLSSLQRSNIHCRPKSMEELHPTTNSTPNNFVRQAETAEQVSQSQPSSSQ